MAESRSILIGFHVCPLCGGKTHVKVRTDVEGKRPYSHCLDEFDQGCSHTGHATTAGQEALLRAAMRPVQGAEAKAPPPAPTPTATPAPAPTATASAAAPLDVVVADDGPAAAPAVPAAPVRERRLSTI